jgi:hypothetical protein
MKRRHKMIHDMVDIFLAERRLSYGGYAEVTKGDMKMLDRLINALVAAKCQGDRPIEHILVNRCVARMPGFIGVPYDGEDVYKNAVFNLGVAYNDFDAAERLRRYREEEAKKKDAQTK